MCRFPLGPPAPPTRGPPVVGRGPPTRPDQPRCAPGAVGTRLDTEPGDGDHRPEYPTYHGARGWFPPGITDEAALEGRARQEADRAVRQAVGERPPVEVRTEARHGTPAGALVEAARGADLLVVGSRGLGGFTGMLLGSVAQHCTRHATVPVVVVRAEDA